MSHKGFRQGVFRNESPQDPPKPSFLSSFFTVCKTACTFDSVSALIQSGSYCLLELRRSSCHAPLDSRRLARSLNLSGEKDFLPAWRVLLQNRHAATMLLWLELPPWECATRCSPVHFSNLACLRLIGNREVSSRSDLFHIGCPQ